MSHSFYKEDHGKISEYSCNNNTGMDMSSDEALILLYHFLHHQVQTFHLYNDPSVRKSYKGHSLPSMVSLFLHNPIHYPLNLQSISVMSERFWLPLEEEVAVLVQ